MLGLCGSGSLAYPVVRTTGEEMVTITNVKNVVQYRGRIMKMDCPECGGEMEPDPDLWHEGVYRCTERDCDFTETR